MPRERFVSYPLADFEDYYLRKRKRVVPEQTCLRPEDYKELKQEMDASFSTYEEQASCLAQPQAKVAKNSRMPQVDGRKLAKLAKHRQKLEEKVYDHYPSLSNIPVDDVQAEE